VVPDLDAHHVVRGGPPAEGEHPGERRLDDVLERPVGGEQAAAGLDERANARDRGGRHLARAVDDEQLLRVQREAVEVRRLHHHVGHPEGAEHGLDMVVDAGHDHHVALLDLVQRAGTVGGVATELLARDGGRRAVGPVAGVALHGSSSSFFFRRVRPAGAAAPAGRRCGWAAHSERRLRARSRASAMRQSGTPGARSSPDPLEWRSPRTPPTSKNAACTACPR